MNVFKKGAHGRLFLFLHCLIVTPASADSLCSTHYYDESAVVASVHDGDTVKLQDGRKIRLIGINTPELAREGKPAQTLATDARDQLKQHLITSDYQVKLLYGKERLDRYKRTLAHLFLPDGQNLQAVLLEKGLARAIAFPPNTAFLDCYRQREQVAHCRLNGIWADKAYATRKSTELDTADAGFSIISGQVERVNETDKGFWLFLDGGVLLGVHIEDLDYFKASELKALKGQNVTVRGWLTPKKKASKDVNFYMRLRHPSSIMPTASNVTKC